MKMDNENLIRQDNNFDNAEHRKEERFPCLAIPLLYSPVSDSYARDLGQKIYQAALQDVSYFGLSFDVDHLMEEGDSLLILIEKPEEDHIEELKVQVRWCRGIADGLYRIGVSIDVSQGGARKSYDNAQFRLKGKIGSPKEVETSCPACKKQATFSFVDYQPVLSGKGVMPLYNCSICGTTRSLLGILT